MALEYTLLLSHFNVIFNVEIYIDFWRTRRDTDLSNFRSDAETSLNFDHSVNRPNDHRRGLNPICVKCQLPVPVVVIKEIFRTSGCGANRRVSRLQSELKIKIGRQGQVD